MKGGEKVEKKGKSRLWFYLFYYLMEERRTKGSGDRQLDELYKHIQDGTAVTQIANQSTFNPDAWCKWFSHYSGQHSKDALRAMRFYISYNLINPFANYIFNLRVVIIKGTIKASEKRSYSLPGGEKGN